MYSKTKTPKGFKPYGTVVIEGNPISGPKVLIESEGQAVLMIGAGASPKVWLYRVSREDGILALTSVIENSISKDELCVIESDKGSFSAKCGEVTILSVVADKDTATITALDCRPLGLNVHSIPGGISIYGCRMVGFKIDSDDNGVLCSLN